MNILFLDDNPERHSTFHIRSGGCEVDHVFTAQEAIRYLDKYSYDIVFLDHDLGGPESENQLVDGAEDGRFVAKWIAENPGPFKETTFIVHSLNTVGNKSICQIIKEAGLTVRSKPFAWTNFNFDSGVVTL
jgi:CheY-like chemotaxis protein